jgi:hypothetical protein
VPNSAESPLEAKVVVPVDQQDKLWTQIDVLDDVRQLSAQRKEDFSGQKAQWEQLRKRQVKLVEMMRQTRETGGETGETQDVFQEMKDVFVGVEEELASVRELMRRK